MNFDIQKKLQIDTLQLQIHDCKCANKNHVLHTKKFFNH